MFEKQFPPVSLIEEDVSEFYTTGTDIFHMHHIYLDKKINSKKKSLGFVF